jgi:hypothetical protein
LLRFPARIPPACSTICDGLEDEIGMGNLHHPEDVGGGSYVVKISGNSPDWPLQYKSGRVAGGSHGDGAVDDNFFAELRWDDLVRASERREDIPLDVSAERREKDRFAG